jgi:hypothetical protein
MRSLLSFPVAFIVLGLAGFASNGADAAPTIAAMQDRLAIVNDVAMYRQYRRSAEPLPADRYDGAIAGDVPAPVVVIRPTSCGLYKYWNGMTCVDARYTNPYLGPKG